MKRKKFVTLSLLIALVLCTICYSGVSKAETTADTEKPTTVKTCSCIINGTERVLTLLSDGTLFFKVKETGYSEVLPDALSVGFDKEYGTVYCIDFQNSIRWWNYDLAPNSPGLHAVFYSTPMGNEEAIINVESLIFDENNEFVIGYKTFSGETYPTLTMDEMKEYLGISDDSSPTPSPDVSPEPTTDPATKVSVKKKGVYTCLYVGNEVVSKYKLTKGVLTWKGTKKSKEIKQVKQAAFIKKSKNLLFMTKSGQAYTISKSGKKKTILKKGAKKFVIKNKFVTKIKKASGGSIDVTKK